MPRAPRDSSPRSRPRSKCSGQSWTSDGSSASLAPDRTASSAAVPNSNHAPSTSTAAASISSGASGSSGVVGAYTSCGAPGSMPRRARSGTDGRQWRRGRVVTACVDEIASRDAHLLLLAKHRRAEATWCCAEPDATLDAVPSRRNDVLGDGVPRDPRSHERRLVLDRRERHSSRKSTSKRASSSGLSPWML